MHKILHFKEIEAATVKIETDEKIGTAFFINAIGEEQLLLTAEHNLPQEITGDIQIVLANGDKLPAALLRRRPEKDIAVLKLTAPIDGITGLPIGSATIAYGAAWESFGFPAERMQAGGRYDGKVSRINTGTKWDIDLDCSQYGTLTDFGGLSGAPLVIDGLVVGVIGYDLAGTLGASSLASVKVDLASEPLSWFEEDEQAVPRSIREDISRAAANDEVLDRLAQAIIDLPGDHYFLINGNPGAGKTTLMAQFMPAEECILVCDRYFVKVPNREDIPTQVRATPEYFMQWATGVYTRQLFDSPPEKKEQPWGDRLTELRRGFQRLSDHYRLQDKTGLLLVDGLDDIPSDKINDFLDLLPDTNCSHLKVVLSCTSRAILPGQLLAKITDDAVVAVTPLINQKVRKYFADVLAVKFLTFEQQSKLADKSEGYPLYMRYLEQYVLALPDTAGLDNWIDTIPQIGGDIAVYYKTVWSKLQNDAAEIWIAAAIARLRHPVEEDMLYQMLSQEQKNAFPVVFPKLQHLLKADTDISIYHTSFSDFIKIKTAQIAEDVHHGIAHYCKGRRDTTFATANVVFHLLNANTADRHDGISTCDQAWADDCTLLDVSSELTLADIKNAIGISAGFGFAAEVIRLLLLSQRIGFRYNTLFEENATYLASALLALKKPAEALRYLVRDDKLTVSDGDAIFLLQRFFEYNFIDEGIDLYEIIKKTGHRLLDTGLNSETFSQFTDLRFNSLALATNAGKVYLDEYFDLKGKVINLLEANNNDQATIDKFKDGIGSYMQGYLAWRFGVPVFIKKQEETHPTTVNDRSAGYLALTINRARQFERLSVIGPEHHQLKNYAQDIQYLFTKYGSVASYDRPLIAALLPYATDFALLESIIKRYYTARPTLNIREENGVDLDTDNIHDFNLYAQSMGYIDQSDNYPKLLPLRRGQWEESLKRQLEYVFFVTGKIYRIVAEGKADKLNALKPRIAELIKNLKFELQDRQHWDRAYALPEMLVPVIWRQLLELLVDHFPAEVTGFINPIIQKNNYQQGLYSEGYMDLLFHLIGTLDKLTTQWPVVYKLAKVLEAHIIDGVENRFEKNEHLLRLIEVYGRLENTDEANRCFKIMLDHSMGPGWYKEGQLSILNSTVQSVLPAENRDVYLQRFAAHLHQASGEMTFQRYVKQEQEDFAGELARAGCLFKAIAYFKYMVFPDYQTILINAESGVVDMPVKGQGYILGARAIEEQAGVLKILESLDTHHSLATWGLAELFVLGDERYLSGYAEIKAGIYDYADLPFKNELTSRIAKFLKTEVDPEHRPEYVSALLSRSSPESRSTLETAFKKNGIVLRKKEKDDDGRSYESKYTDPLDSLKGAKITAEAMLEMGNKSAARKLLIEALSDVQAKKYSIWSDIYSEKINAMTSLFSQAYDQSAAFITDIRDLLVNEPYFEAWVVADKLIRLLGPMAGDAEKNAIAQAVDEHAQLMVRTPPKMLERYHWLNIPETSEVPEEEQLLELLIWFLSHPDLVVKDRTVEILVWLGGQSPHMVIPVLVQTLFRPGYQLAKELAAAILHQLGAKKHHGFWSVLEASLAAHEDQLKEMEHFMVINSLIELLEQQIANGEIEASKYLDILNDKFTAPALPNPDVYFEEDYLEPINDYLYALSAAGISNGKFAKLLVERIAEHSPLPVADCLQVNKYIDGSFNDHYHLKLVPDFETLLRFCLNISVTQFVPASERKKVGDILRFYQPTFPENSLTGQFNGPRDIDILIKQLALGETANVTALTGQDIYLQYVNESFDKETRHEDSFECNTYLVPISDWKENFRFRPECQFMANMYADSEAFQNEEICIPLITESYPLETVGSPLTPSFPVCYSEDSPYAFIKDEARMEYWRNGRIWDQNRRGAPIATGYCVHIPKHKLNKLKTRYKLIMEVCYDYNFAYIDVFAQKIIKYESPK